MYSDLPLDALGSNDDADHSAASDPPFSLKSEMARVMQVVADKERERIGALVGDEETAQVDRIHARAAAEAAQLSKHADEEVGLVNTWYHDQVKQLRAAADHQIEDRRNRLADSLSQHDSLIGAEVQSVHSAVEGYRAFLDTFFGRLAEEQDPSVIARLAGTLPDLPDLDSVRADARARGMREGEPGLAPDATLSVDEDHPAGPGPSEPEPELVPVMDPAAVKQRVSILSGLGMPVGRPGPSALLGGRPAGDATEPETQDTAEAASADENVAVPAIQASTLWNATPGDSEG